MTPDADTVWNRALAAALRIIKQSIDDCFCADRDAPCAACMEHTRVIVAIESLVR